jgi:hypothetical protein
LELPEKPGGIPVNLAAAVGAIGGLFNSGNPTATVLKTNEFKDRVREMYESLKDARDKHRLVRIETTLREYENMVIERVAVPRTVPDGDGATFQLDLKQIRFVKSETVEAPEPAELRGMLPKALGSKSAKKNDDEKKSEKAKSIAAKLFDGAGGSLSGIVGF